MKPNQIICGSNIDVVKPWSANCVDGICTDPPYGLGFMGKDWDTFKQENVNKPNLTKLTYKTDYRDGVPIKRNKPEMVTRDSGARRAGSYDLSRNPEFQQWFTVWAKAMLRITKPGGFLLCFGGTRTYHRLTCAIEDAGWEIRDCMMWLYGSGFPKSHNISKAIDKAAGAKRKVIGTRPVPGYARSEVEHGKQNRTKYEFEQTSDEATTPLAQLWNGYGTALKPAWEPIIVAMKPLDGTFAHNAERHGVAGLNIEATRISHNEPEKQTHRTADKFGRTHAGGKGWRGKPEEQNLASPNPQGRWPANLVLDEEAGAMLDEQTGTKKSGFMSAGTKRKMSDNPNKNTYGKFNPDTVANDTYGDSGGASRFFYCAKTSRKERNMGMEDCEDKLLARSGGAQGAENRGEKEYLQKHIGLNRVAVVKNNHPTVKPLALMKYLCTLLKMPSTEQIILDPFMGSGTTGMACASLGIGFIGIEKEPDYCEISAKRIAAITGKTLPVTKNVETFRDAIDFAGGNRVPNESLPHVSEHRQSIINAAAAALRRNQ